MLYRKQVVGPWEPQLTGMVLIFGCLLSPARAGTAPKIESYASAPKTGPDACGASLSGAKVLRRLTPYMMATTDYSEDRPNVFLRAVHVIDAVKCG